MQHPGNAAILKEEIAHIIKTTIMSSSVLAIKTFEETRVVWSAMNDHAAVVTGVVKRLIAGELTSDDLATPESTTDMGGQGFDKVRNPNWFRGLYGRALSRVCVSTRIPADLYDALQNVANWQDTLRKALQRLANDVHVLLQERKQSETEVEAKPEPETQEFEVVMTTRKDFYYHECPSFESYFDKRGKDYHKLFLELRRLNVRDKLLPLLMMVDEVFEDFGGQCHRNGEEALRSDINLWVKTSKKWKNDAGIEATAKHILSGLRLVRAEMREMAAA